MRTKVVVQISAPNESEASKGGELFLTFCKVFTNLISIVLTPFYNISLVILTDVMKEQNCFESS